MKISLFYCCFCCCCRHRCWWYFSCCCFFSCTLLIYSSVRTLELNLHRARALFFLLICPLHYLHTLTVSPFDMFVAKLTNCICYVLFLFFFLRVGVHSVGVAAAAAVATLFMSHIRNACGKRSNFLHQCFKHSQVHNHTSIRAYVCSYKYGCFLFQLVILIHFLFAHMN